MGVYNVPIISGFNFLHLLKIKLKPEIIGTLYTPIPNTLSVNMEPSFHFDSNENIKMTIENLQKRFQNWFVEFDSLEDCFLYYLPQDKLQEIKNTLCECMCCERHFMDLKGDKDKKYNNELCQCHCRQYRRMCERVLKNSKYCLSIKEPASETI